MQITTHFSDVTGIACDSSAQYCVAVGYVLQPQQIDHLIYISQDGGIHWSANPILAHPDSEDTSDHTSTDPRIQMKIACSNTGMDCTVAGTTTKAGQPYILTYHSHDGGLNWSTPTILPLFHSDQPPKGNLENLPLVNVQCGLSGMQCMIASHTPYEDNNEPIVYLSKNGGDSWSEPIFLPLRVGDDAGIRIHDLSCDHSGLICTAIGSTKSSRHPNGTPIMYATQDGGQSWSPARSLLIAQLFNADYIISKHDFLNQISCDYTGLNCIAIGHHHQKTQYDEIIPLNSAYQSKDAGRSWRHAIEIDANDRFGDNIFTALHCDVGASICTAVGYNAKGEELQPIIYTTSDAGQSWQKKEFEPPLAALGLLDVFCADNAAICHAIGFVLPS
ncbi:MAG TPA: sialidase family protein [Legionellaceae bacterium]|nr:sialidase family protein [Legionellaceae bacterium]